MALTLAEMITEVCDVVGKSVSASSASGATLEDRVTRYLNFGQRRIARFHNFHELNALKTDAATVANVKIYPLSTGTNNLGLTNVKDIITITIQDSQNSWKINRWSPRKFDTKFPRPENYSTDRPRIYIRYGNSLEFFYIPNDAYTLQIRYAKWATPLTTSSQTSDFENKDELIIATGIFETYLALEEYVDAKVWWERVKGYLEDAMAVEGDIDWSPVADEFTPSVGYGSGTPYSDPFADSSDPLYGYE